MSLTQPTPKDIKVANLKTVRCDWANSNELFIPYHDKEWGVVVHDDRKLFEMLNLEGAQAGLSWLTVLKKRDSYRKAFDNFDAKKIAKYDEAKRTELINNEGIIRNRLKVNAFIENAKAYLAVQKQFSSFDNYIWGFVDNKVLNHKDHARAVTISEQMSKDMKKQGFRFVGPTICYAFMQATGLLDDHAPYCFRSAALISNKI
jgi:DNA-3-methyladenine glycosylase I